MTSARWRAVWDEWPRRFTAGDHLRQVAKTVGGVAVDAAQVQAMTDDVASRLCLGPADVLLDLCCGNGLLTVRLASRCRHVVGVDFSAPLLEVARRDHQTANVSYVHASVLDLDRLSMPPGSFTKVLLYDALQHFTASEFRRLLAHIVPLLADDRLVLLGGVPYRPCPASMARQPVETGAVLVTTRDRQRPARLLVAARRGRRGVRSRRPAVRPPRPAARALQRPLPRRLHGMVTSADRGRRPVTKVSAEDLAVCGGAPCSASRSTSAPPIWAIGLGCSRGSAGCSTAGG